MFDPDPIEITIEEKNKLLSAANSAKLFSAGIPTKFFTIKKNMSHN